MYLYFHPTEYLYLVVFKYISKEFVFVFVFFNSLKSQVFVFVIEILVKNVLILMKILQALQK